MQAFRTKLQVNTKHFNSLSQAKEASWFSLTSTILLNGHWDQYVQTSAPAKIFVYIYGELYQCKECFSLELPSKVVLHVFIKRCIFSFWRRWGSGMPCYTVQLWQLVTAMQHFNQNFVITGLSLSLTPSPLDAVPETVPFTSVKQWMWGLQNWAWHLEARVLRLHGALASQWKRTCLSQSVSEYTAHLIFWSCHPLILTIPDKINHFNEAKWKFGMKQG